MAIKQPGLQQYSNVVLKRGVFKVTKAQFMLKKALVKSLVKVI